MKTKSRTLLNKITRIFSIDKELALNGKFSEKLMMEIMQENNVESERNNNKFNNKLFYILENIERSNRYYIDANYRNQCNAHLK